MKKNFLKVAALLIAAMLMVVSCTQEVAPVDNGLVKASVNIADTRALSTTGEGYDGITYQYKLTALFSKSTTESDTNIVEGNSTIVGNMSEYKALPSTSAGKHELGYVTQGLWQIEIQGIDVNNGNKVVLYGKANHYFNNQNEVAYVFVDPKNTSGGYVSINVGMQDLEDSSSSNYSVKYALTKIDASTESTPEDLTRVPKTGNYSEYKTNSNISAAAGYYRLTISVWGPALKSDGTVDSGADPVILGGVTKSIRVLEGRTVSVTGSVEPKDFDKSEVKVVIIDPVGTIDSPINPVTKTDIVLTVNNSTKELMLAGLEEKTGTSESILTGNDYIKYYVWDVNGEKVDTTSSSHTVNFPVPGPKSVSCTIVYKVMMFGKVYTYVSADSNVPTVNFTVMEASSN